jgi:hypothetical protein
MSDLNEAIEQLYQEHEQNLQLAIVHLAEIDDVPLDDLSSVVLILERDSGDGVIARLGWGPSGVHVDLHAYVDGDEINASVFQLEGTTSVMAARP